MGMFAYLDENIPVSPPADQEATMSALANTLKQTVLDFRLDPHAYPKLVKIGLFAPSSGSSFLTFWPLINGQLTSYGAIQSRNSAPDDDNYLPFAINVPRFARVQLLVDNTDPSNAYSVTGRMVLNYYEHW
jgi:hypothetical protein